MNAIRRRLKESWILPEALAWLTVTIDGFQSIQTGVRELARCCSNNRTVLFMKFSELRHESAREHPFEIRDPRGCKEFWTRIVPQRMKVKVIEDICNDISYDLIAYVSVSS